MDLCSRLSVDNSVSRHASPQQSSNEDNDAGSRLEADIELYKVSNDTRDNKNKH